MNRTCANCGHSEDDHTYTDSDGCTEPSPCVVMYGRMRICGCLYWMPEESESA